MSENRFYLIQPQSGRLKRVPQMGDKRPRTVDELVNILDKVLCSGKGWLQSLPPRHDGEIPSNNAAKQLAEEASEFATSLSDAIKRGHIVSAYANERLLVDRFLHAARFFEEPRDVVGWSYWSIAEINRLVSSAMSQGAVNPQDRELMRELLQVYRHWNRSESDKDRQMSKPSGYEWHRTRRELVDDSNARFKSNYDITSTYVHPTYRGDRSPDPGQEYVLEQAICIACSTFIICGATLISQEDDLATYHVDQHLLDLVETLNYFLADSVKTADTLKHWSGGMDQAHMLILYGSMLVTFTFGRDIIEGQPRFV